jgi:hypothetical protein
MADKSAQSEALQNRKLHTVSGMQHIKQGAAYIRGQFYDQNGAS